ncbi:MAG: tryptophan synthase subunit alpha [Gammaproteobacteria bacterium]|nr:tryptophan synthase subunit alpha [Gammaproteobacteria bacterium]
MSRIQSCFDALKGEGKKGLIPFVTAGDPNPEITVPLMHAMVDAGASIIELGVPFSDPMADGPVIQKANERALKHHVSLRQVLDMVRSFRSTNETTPVVLMGYLNPVEIMGYETFAEQASQAGVDGVILVDLPPEEAEEVMPLFRAKGIDMIFLLSPTSRDARIEKIARLASGFIYYVSIKGVTGAASADVDEVAARLETIRKHTDLPIGIGFGIKDAATAARFSAVGDAVVVGSALVRKVEELSADTQKIFSEVPAVLGEMRQAMDSQ